ncbi:heme-binding protein 2-like [Phoenix dactylifera]|uniref:Heme-binding protein 2-like n=1 Tax=Phoenix dactylifera TaxID=42345 RepID=A0A8B7BRN7_PHODC|nr:heme-binding protein 2-like [Phoenix dactylifera]
MAATGLPSWLSSILPCLLLVIFVLPWPSAAYQKVTLGVFPPTCARVECPMFDVIDEGNGYEIRRYNSSVWMSTSSIDDISFVNGTRTGFLRLFDYVKGKNENGTKMAMTAPVMTEVSTSKEPSSNESFVVSFFIGKRYQANPPSAQGLHLLNWNLKYAAVRQFGGYATDAGVPEEAAALDVSLRGSKWARAVDESRKANPMVFYTVAQYSAPFRTRGRVNEIWMLFDDITTL